MDILWQILFWGSVGCLAHTYVLYPLILQLLARNKQNNQLRYTQPTTLPKVAVLMSLYNEEKVIAEKLDSLLQSNYPSNHLYLYIGSDCSVDR